MNTPKFGPLGSIVDVRTYRRWLPEEQRRETFYERNQRVVDYNIGLAGDKDPDIEKDRELMLEFMNEFLAFPSGRAMWVGGTKISDRHQACTFNCSALAINRSSAFLTVFELLMLGTGVGYRVFQKDIDKLPAIVFVPEIKFEEYIPTPARERLEETRSEELSDYILWVEVGDSRQGWIDALGELLRVTFENDSVEEIVFNVDSIRPMGERIYGFGGTASGPEALKGIIQDVHRVLEECPGRKLRSIDCMDICDAIAKGVVAGSSRRSALICLFEEGDDLCAYAKRGLFTDPALAHKQYRIQSNNTECIGSSFTEEFREFLENNPDADWEVINKEIEQYKPSPQWLRERFEVVRHEGEPGFCNYLMMCARRWKAVRQWRPECPIKEIWVKYCNAVSNPCMEIILSAGYHENVNKCGYGVSFCNLSTLPLQNFVINSRLDYCLLKQAVELIVRIGLRQTCVTMPRDELHKTQIEERLLGVSATGWRMLFDMLGWDTASPEVIGLQKRMNLWANEEATRYAKVLGVPRPLLVTCVKPEGTSSKVFGSSDGLHWDWAPYYIRRIQMSTTDALAQTHKEQGFIWHPKDYDLSRLIKAEDSEATIWDRIQVFRDMPNQEKERIFFASNAVTFDFPIKSPASVSSGEVSALEQLENVKSFTVHYADHMPSSTVTVKDHEWDDVAKWIYDNWDSYITASFLSYFNGSYPLLPYEAIAEERYQELISNFELGQQVIEQDGVLKFLVDEELLAQKESALERKGVDLDDVALESGCESGACPVR